MSSKCTEESQGVTGRQTMTGTEDIASITLRKEGWKYRIEDNGW